MIVTLTLNPAIDENIVLNNLNINTINKVENIYIEPGGKGINVSKGIRTFNLDHETILLNDVKDKNFLQLIKNKNISFTEIEVPMKIRRNLKIIDKSNNTCTDINEEAYVYPCSFNILHRILETIKSKNPTIIALCGSLPEGLEKNIYAKIIEFCNKNKIKVFLDINGKLLKDNLFEKVFFVKPNLDELCDYHGKPLKSKKEIINAAFELKKYADNICISLGENGMIFLNNNSTYICTIDKVNALNTVGAGDSMVSAFIYGFTKNWNIEKIIKFACAVSIKSVTMESSSFPSLDGIDSYVNKIKLKKYREGESYE
ncbi:MAG: 1-phosphofructokinase family hexose kinase [Lachnospirales bacterium]